VESANPSVTIIGTSTRSLPSQHTHGTSPLTCYPPDVREPGELQGTGHIPHAINVPITSYPDSFHISSEEFEDRFGFPRPDKDSEVLFYCKSGVRSRGAAGIAKDAGWKKVGEYPGSWMDWFNNGGKVER
jgi:rhodanese-related sulfurtransferase